MPPIEETFSAEETAAWAQHGVSLDQSTDSTALDTIVATSGEDTIATGNDTVATSTESDTLAGGQGNDVITPPPGFVPHQALHAERTRYAALAQQMAQLQARTNAILSERTQQQQRAQIDLEQDPVGYVQQLQERLDQFEQQQTQRQQQSDLETRFEADEAAFAAYTPDYTQAMEYYVKSRASELMIFNTPQEVQRILKDEVRAIAEQSWQRGIPAAQSVYNLAKARGYTTPQQPVTQQPVEQPRQPNGQFAPPAPAAVVQAVQQGQQVSRSLSQAGGGATKDVNAEALLAMNDEEFEQFLKLGSKGADARFAAVAGRM